MTNKGMSKEIHLYDLATGKYVKSYNSQSQLENELGLYRGATGDFFRGKMKRILISKEKHEVHPLFDGMQVVIPTTAKEQTTGLLSEEELRQKHDMFYQIYGFVRNIPDGKFAEETSMLRQLALLGKPRYREALSRPDLKPYRGKVDGMTYYGSQNSIQKLKGEGVLQ